MEGRLMQLGEGFAGSGSEAAHVNTVVGLREGPVGTAWAIALSSPSDGHTPFVAVLRPGLPVQPYTLFINKVTVRDERHQRLTWGAAQAGIASGVADAAADGLVPDPLTRAVIAAVWVDAAAADEDGVFANNRAAIYESIRTGFQAEPMLGDVLLARDDAWNPFFRPR
jgi:5,6,7,8-tetrahydromethanopterin hydro-lyase